MSSTSILGHKRTSSGRIESKENFTEEGSTFSSPDLSGGSGSKPRPHYTSPGTQPHLNLHRNAASITSLGDRESPRDTRIPRPKTTAANTDTAEDRRTPGSPYGLGRRVRQPIGLKAAFKLAEAQEARDRSGSSSSSGSIDLKQAFQMANAEANRVAAGSPSPAPRSYRRRESIDTRTNQFFSSPNHAELGQRLREFDHKYQLGSNGGHTEGLFTTKGRVGPKVAETATTLARKVSNGSLGSSPVDRRENLAAPNTGYAAPNDRHKWNAARHNSLLPSVEFEPLPPVEIEGDENQGSPSLAKPTNPSPEKSYNWNLDADFTADDLQISDSPRIKLGRNVNRAGDSPAAKSTQSRWNSDKLDEIRQLEIQAENAHIPDDESSFGSKRTNSKLDEIRAREMVASSPRVLAEGRLEEIRARNAEARSRSTSPEETKRPNRQSPSEKPLTTSSAIYVKDNKVSIQIDSASDQKDGLNAGMREVSSGPSQPLIRDDSYDLLRRLTEATSPSPSPDNSPQVPVRDPREPAAEPTSQEQDSSQPRSIREARRSRDARARSSGDRLSVGFAGLHKLPPGDSVDLKRRSINSETDPVDRIEAEKKLFDALDNFSEKSSTRASSRLSERSEPREEETPKPKRRLDPLSLPTPRVMGAYVETPATVKAERDEEWIDVESEVPLPRKSALGRLAEKATEPRIKREGDESMSKAAKTTAKPSAASARRSKHRQRKRPLLNTANIPTVKEDLRAILQQHRIDDSTLDDFDGLLDDQDIDADELEKLVGDTVLKIEEELKVPGLTDHERELQAYDRMSKSLQTGLLGIRSAKHGIERLEDKVSHSEQKGTVHQADLGLRGSTSSVSISPSSQLGHGVYVAWPILFHRQPRFRLTPLGMFAFLFAMWYTIESIFCSLYVEQYECPRGMVCDWSPNEPYFPYAAPFMIDEWTTGGKGRALAWRVGDEVGDVVAELSDWVTGHDFRKDEVMYMNIWERKRHRRRLYKRGLYWKWTEPVQFRNKFQAWRNAWTERQRAIEEGEAIWGDESMGGDQRL